MVDSHTAPDEVDVAVGLRIRDLRRRRRMTQGGLAEAVGVTFQQIQKYERGANRVSASMLARIAQALETQVSTLFGEAAAGEEVHDATALLREPGAIDLLVAYHRMPKGPTRAKLVAFVESLTG